MGSFSHHTKLRGKPLKTKFTLSMSHTTHKWYMYFITNYYTAKSFCGLYHIYNISYMECCFHTNNKFNVARLKSASCQLYVFDCIETNFENFHFLQAVATVKIEALTQRIAQCGKPNWRDVLHIFFVIIYFFYYCHYILWAFGVDDDLFFPIGEIMLAEME